MITASTIIKTEFGNFKVSYHKFGNKICVSFSYGDLRKNEPIVRFHSACLFGEAFHSLHCDCQHQIIKVMSLIQTNGSGVIIYSYEEGRGIGLENKIKAMELERTEKIDTVEAFKKLGFDKADCRDYDTEIKALERAGYIVEKIIPEEPLDLSDIAKKEREIKVKKLGYKY